jgi:hypothetical protein
MLQRPHKRTVSKYTAMQTVGNYFICGFIDVLRLNNEDAGALER